MSEWRDIATAPKDGTRVRLLIPYSRELYTEAECTDCGHWEPLPEDANARLGTPEWGIAAGGCWRFDGDDGAFDIRPTHWQPLPDPPSS